jgi:hypothetical protein
MTSKTHTRKVNRKCPRCGEAVWTDDGPCGDGLYYCYECILGDHCGCERHGPRRLLRRLWDAIRRV